MGKGEDTRNAVLDHAVALASRVGLEGLSIGGLAKDTGLSKSGLFAHFDSKQNLQLGVLRTSVERFISIVVAPALKKPRGLPRVQSLFENWLSWSTDPSLPGGCFFIAAAHELDDRPGPLRDQLVAYQQDWLDGLATAARIAVEEDHFRPDLDTKQFAYEFYGILMMYHYASRLMRDPDAEQRARTSMWRLLESAGT